MRERTTRRKGGFFLRTLKGQEGDTMELGGLGWIFAVNLIIWTGLFVFLLRIERRIAGLEAGGKGR